MTRRGVRALPVAAIGWLWMATACAGEAVTPSEGGSGGSAALWTNELFGLELWRIASTLGIIVVVLVVNILVRHFFRQAKSVADRVDEDARLEAEAAGGEADTADETAQAERSWKQQYRQVISMLLDSAQLPIRVALWGVALRIAGPILTLGESYVAWGAQLILSLAVALFIYNLVEIVEYFFLRFAEKTETGLDDMLAPVLRKSLRILVVIVMGLHIYHAASGKPITTLIAGLGLGGLAFALAAQDTLKNLFGFGMILADQPFLVGERINYDGHDGIIESMGFRSAKLRRLDGHQVIIPNSKAADAVIHNIGRRPYIRRVFNITITYDTPPEKVEKAVEIVREILDNHECMDPDLPPRVYFSDFNAASLGILVIYWFHPAEGEKAPDYWQYLDHGQRVNLEIMRRYEAEGIEFAFPTQTLYLAGDPKRELILQHLNAEAARAADPSPGGEGFGGEASTGSGG
jgi:MscS family membrane protein